MCPRQPDRAVPLLLLSTLALACSRAQVPASKGEAPPAQPAPPTASTDPAPSAPAGDAGAAPAPLPSPEVSVNPGINDRNKTAEGRAISAKVFDSPERASYQMPDELMQHFAIKPGQVVADVAAGTGYMTSRLSAAVGPKGKVYAEDIQPEYLD